MSEYNGTTIPQVDDRDRDLLRKICKLLNDGGFGGGGGGGSADMTETNALLDSIDTATDATATATVGVLSTAAAATATNTGTIATSNAAIKTACESVVTSNAAIQTSNAAIKTAVEGATPAGTNIIGKVAIDQTTPGTTNAVAVIAGQSGVAGGSGVTGATVQRVVLATDVALPAGTNLLGKTGIDQTTPGTTNAVAIIPGQNGVAGGSGVTGATVQRVVLATDVALPAGANFLGNVGGSSKTVSPTITTTAAAIYAVGDSAGGKITLTNAMRISGGTGTLTDIVILDRSNQKPALEIYIFDSDPAAATLGDKTAFQFSTDDLKVIGKVLVAPSDYTTTNGKATAHIKNLAIGVEAVGSANLYAAIVVTGTPTFASTSGFQPKFKFLRD